MDFFISNAFWSVIFIWFGAVIMPGADMFFVIRSAISEGKKSAYFACFGIVAGTIVWLIVGFFFVQVLSKTSFFEIVQVIGGGYLLWMAWKIFLSAQSQKLDSLKSDQDLQNSPKKNFFYGLLTNLSNPKPPIFVGIILSKLPQGLAFEYSLFLLCVMSLISLIWFIFVVRVFSIERFFRIFMRYSKAVDYGVVGMFGLFGLSLIFDGVRSLLLHYSSI